MNETTTKTRPTPDGLTHGTCRLRWWPDDLATCLENGAVILELRPSRGKWSEYWVTTRRGQNGELRGYRLEKFVGHPEEAAPVYHLELTASGLSCDCPDAKRRNRACKHQRALVRCLKVHGRWPVAAALAPLETL